MRPCKSFSTLLVLIGVALAMGAFSDHAAAINLNWDDGYIFGSEWFSSYNWDPNNTPQPGDYLHVLNGDTPHADSAVTTDGGGSINVRGSSAHAAFNAGLYVGNTGIGRLYISEGGDVTNTSIYIGNQAGSQGTVSVGGTGSTFTNSSYLRVGRYGTGTLNINSGGSVSNTIGFIGVEAGSNGTVTVDGSGSTWTNTSLYVGGSDTAAGDTGALTIKNGGKVNATGTLKIWNTGTLTFDGGRMECGIFDNTDIGTFNFTAGTLSFTDNLQVDSVTPFGASDNDDISSTRILEVANTLSVGAGGTLTLAGGRVECTTFDNTSGGTFVFNSGTLAFADNLQVDTGSPFGASGSDDITSTRTLEVANTLSLGISGTLTLEGGRIECTAFDNTSGGTFDFSSGTLSILGNLQIDSASTFSGNTISSASTLEVADTLSLSIGGTLTLDGGRVECGAFDNTSSGTFTHDSGTMDVVGGSFDPGTADYSIDGSGNPILQFSGGSATLSGGLQVADTGTGTMNINSGGSVTNTVGSIGNSAIAMGTATVDGTGSTWNNTSLYVGGSDTASGGTGTLTVQNGGTVNVTGTLKIWNSGTVELLGSQINAGSFIIEPGGTFTHDSGILDVTGEFNPGTDDYTINGAGNPTVQLTGGSTTLSGDLWIASSDSGTLNITGGTDVTNITCRIGQYAGSDGTVTVDGAGSTWHNSGSLSIGFFGTGSLDITDGADVSSSIGYIGVSSGSGTVTVDGAGSTWTNSSLYIGGSDTAAGGTGSLTVQNEGKVDATGILKIWNTGTLTLDGGRVECGIFDNTDIGTFNFTAGTLAFTGNLQVDSGTPFGATGGDTISSARTLEVADTLSIGSAGQLTLDGGRVECTAFDNTSGGMFNFNSGTLAFTGDLRIDSSTPFGNPIGDTISSACTLEVADTLTVGDSGTGTLGITGGGTVSNIVSYIGNTTGSVGTVTVDGAGSTWINNSNLHVGREGTGTLTITNGGGVNDAWGIIGDVDGSDGSVTVSGAGSTWTNSGYLLVGHYGTGMLEINDGGSVTNTSGSLGGNIGYYVDSAGTVTVSGNNSKLINYAYLYVGREGTGTLDISDGGSVSNTTGAIGTDTGSDGTVTVGGTGSTWNNNSLYVGGISAAAGGTGTLTVQTGGTVNVANTLKVWDAGTLTLDGGRVECTTFSNTSGGTFNFNSGTLAFADDLWINSSTPFGAVGEDAISSARTLEVANTLSVGYSGTATMDITDGGSVSDTWGYIGNQAASNGTVTVDGAGSTWHSDNYLCIGRYGNGTLIVTGGGTVSNDDGYIASQIGSTGTVTIGAGSTWTNNGNLYVGGHSTTPRGDAELTIAGSVNVTDTLILWDTSTLTINSGRLECGTFEHTHGGTFNFPAGTLAFTGNLQVNSITPLGAVGGDTISPTRTLEVADTLSISSAGTLTIDGGRVESGTFDNTSGGTFNFTGGTLAFTSNLQIDSRTPFNASDSDTIYSTRTLEVGNTLSIGTGGALTLDGGNVACGAFDNTNGGTFTHNNGILTVDGGVFSPGNSIYTIDGAGAGDLPTVKLTAGATWNLGFSPTGMYVGYDNAGALEILGGSSVIDEYSNIGQNPGGEGVVTVDGAGSTWNNKDLMVGVLGTGTLNIANGGEVVVDRLTLVEYDSGSTGEIHFGTGGGTLSTETLLAQPSRLTGTGTVNTRGLLSDIDLVFDSSHGLTQTLTLDSEPGQNITLNLDMSDPEDVGYLGAGYRGSGSLTIQDGVAVQSERGYIGYDSGSTGTATVSGVGSTWTTDSLAVGFFGTGILDINGGGSVVNTDYNVVIGGLDGDGTVTVTGAGSTLTTNEGLYVGDQGNSTLDINGGGSVSTGTDGFIGYRSTSDGLVTVEGADSAWNVNSSLYIGGDTSGAGGTGTLTIQNNGAVSADDTLRIWSSGTLTLDGGRVECATFDNTDEGMFNFAGGTLAFIDDLQIDSSTPFGANGGDTISSTRTLEVADTLTLSGTGALTLSGGTIQAGAFDFAAGTFNFNYGTLHNTSDLLVEVDDNILGGSHTLGLGRHLMVSQTTTLNDILTLDGGTFTTSSLVNPELMQFTRGTFNLTGDDLTIGSGGIFGNTLSLSADKTVAVTNNTTVESTGQLLIQGGGFSAASLTNQGQILLEGFASSLTAGSLTNSGLVTGRGTVDGTFDNASSGTILATASDYLYLTGSNFNNSGQVNLVGGTIRIAGTAANELGGVVSGHGGLLFDGGLTNHGAMNFGADTEIYGDVVNGQTGSMGTDGQVVVSGGASVSFHDDVVHNGVEFKVSDNADVAFFGAVSGDGSFTGGGGVWFEGDYSPGNSPAVVTFAGDVTLGDAATLVIELSGTEPGEFDIVDVGGTLSLDGTLDVRLINGFAPSVDDTFDILDWSALGGTFDEELLPAPGGYLAWDSNDLYVSGEISVIGSLPGDANVDGKVNVTDLGILATNYGLGGGLGWGHADFNGDGNVNVTDLGILATHYGQTAATAAVPEPGAMLLLLSAAVSLMIRRRIK